MGNPMTHAVVQPIAQAAKPTALLRFIAGDAAPAIAGVWPKPHLEFFGLPTARRHAAAILLQQEADGGLGVLEDIKFTIEFRNDAQLAVRIGGEGTSRKLLKMLGACGETLWTAEQYSMLLELYRDGEAAKVLRHLKAITPETPARLGRIPTPLRRAGIFRCLPDNADAVLDLAIAYELCGRMRSEAEMVELTRLWERAGSTKALFNLAASMLQPTQFEELSLPLDLGPEYVRVKDRKQLEGVALEFRNCLRDFTRDVSLGLMAIYIRRVGGKPVCIALRQDPAGWRLAEARGVGNADVSDQMLRQIVSDVRHAGGRTGESLWVIAERLHQHVCDNCGSAYPPVRETWRDALTLGTLWN